MLARLELPRRGRGPAALTLPVGATGAIVLATAAGARRSDTALERFNTWARSSDAEISIGNSPTAQELDTFRRTPGLAAMARLRGYALSTEADENLALATPVDTDMGSVVARSRVIHGRQFDPAASDELTIGEALAKQLRLHVGSRLSARSFTPAQIVTAFSNGNPGAPRGPTGQLHVVGIVRRPLDLGVRAASGGVALISPGFNAKYRTQIGAYTDVLRVRTVHGASDLPRVLAAARKLWGDQQAFQVQGLGIETE